MGVYEHSKTKSHLKNEVHEAEFALVILVVDSDPGGRKLLEAQLTSSGYQVVSAGNGRAALELFRKQFFPIVITDSNMPEMDGFEFCRAIREQDHKGYVFIIILTEKSSKEDMIVGLEAGADDYLIKPVYPGELIARLNTAQRIIRLEQSLRQRNEEIAQLSITDPLTESYNRRYLMAKLPLEIKRTLRYYRPLSLMLCDIDNFKQINDLYGHQIGDMMLREVTQAIMSAFRQGVDWLARYGGEEFVIVLPETDLTFACKAAERYRRLISERMIRSDAGAITVTVSIGVAGYSPSEDDQRLTAEVLIAAADHSLYKAKNKGKNKVIGISISEFGRCDL